MKLSEIFEKGKENCPAVSGGWCHLIGDEPCTFRICPVIYWAKIMLKIRGAERDRECEAIKERKERFDESVIEEAELRKEEA